VPVAVLLVLQNSGSLLAETESIGGRCSIERAKKLNFIEKTRMIFSNRWIGNLGQRDFESIEGAAKADICEEEGL
jgi:hypothetical protein